MAREEATVNFHRLVRDLRKILRKSGTTRLSDRPTFYPLIENKSAPFFTTFHPIGYRDVKAPDNGISICAFRGKEEVPDNSQRLAHDLRKILIKNHGQSTANLGDPLSGT